MSAHALLIWTVAALSSIKNSDGWSPGPKVQWFEDTATLILRAKKATSRFGPDAPAAITLNVYSAIFHSSFFDLPGGYADVKLAADSTWNQARRAA